MFQSSRLPACLSYNGQFCGLDLNGNPLISMRGEVKAEKISFITFPQPYTWEHMMTVSVLFREDVRVTFNMSLQHRFIRISIYQIT